MKFLFCENMFSLIINEEYVFHRGSRMLPFSVPLVKQV